MTATNIAKEQWAAEYARRILKLWQEQRPPLGIDSRYAKNIEEQLESYFDNPLKRELIETTY